MRPAAPLGCLSADSAAGLPNGCQIRQARARRLGLVESRPSHAGVTRGRGARDTSWQDGVTPDIVPANGSGGADVTPDRRAGSLLQVARRQGLVCESRSKGI